jgi:hypothetical protein
LLISARWGPAIVYAHRRTRCSLRRARPPSLYVCSLITLLPKHTFSKAALSSRPAHRHPRKGVSAWRHRPQLLSRRTQRRGVSRASGPALRQYWRRHGHGCSQIQSRIAFTGCTILLVTRTCASLVVRTLRRLALMPTGQPVCRACSRLRTVGCESCAR